MQRAIINTITGQQEIVDLTPEEIAEIEVYAQLPPPVPQEVSRFQAKTALSRAGLLQQANDAVAASGNIEMQLAWAEATVFRRDSPSIKALAPALGLDDAALDDLFRLAASIQA